MPNDMFLSRSHGGNGGAVAGDCDSSGARHPPFSTSVFLSTGIEHNDASQITYGPLAAFNPDREFVPVLVKESPSLDNGSLAQEGTAATSRSDQSIMRIDKLDD